MERSQVIKHTVASIATLLLLQTVSMAQSIDLDAWRVFGDARFFMPACDTVVMVSTKGNTTYLQRFIKSDKLVRAEQVHTSGLGKTFYHSQYDTALVSRKAAKQTFRITNTVNDSVILTYMLLVTKTPTAVLYRTVSVSGKAMITTRLRTNRSGRVVSSRSEGNGEVAEKYFKYKRDTLLQQYSTYLTRFGNRGLLEEGSLTYEFDAQNRLTQLTELIQNDSRGVRNTYKYTYEGNRLSTVTAIAKLLYPMVDNNEGAAQLFIRYGQGSDRVLTIIDYSDYTSEFHVSCK